MHISKRNGSKDSRVSPRFPPRFHCLTFIRAWALKMEEMQRVFKLEMLSDQIYPCCNSE